jgi:Tol biopolymer transport system component
VFTAGAAFPGYPSWDATGKSFVFTDFAKNILFRVSSDGGEPVAITDQKQVLAGMSSVSPDGKWIAFAGQKAHGQAYNQEENQIWLVDDHGNVRPLESSPLPGRTPSWSPDGERIAFESDRGSPDGHYAAFTINRDGTGLTQVTDYALNASHPVFSPDGRKLAFAMGDPARNQSNIVIVDLPDPNSAADFKAPSAAAHFPARP